MFLEPKAPWRLFKREGKEMGLLVSLSSEALSVLEGPELRMGNEPGLSRGS